MSNAPAKSAPTAPSNTPVKAPAETSPLRMGILLGLLFVVLLMLGHHFMFGKPATDKAFDDIQQLFDDRNALGVVSGENSKIDAKLVKPADVQELLGKKPWSTNTQKDYTIETYWWYGMPHQNYITILYYGAGDDLRFNTHYKNSKPEAEDLPGAVANEGPPLKDDSTPPTTDSDTPAAPPGPGTEKPAAETPAEKPEEEKPEAKPAEEKPAEKPAESTEEK